MLSRASGNRKPSAAPRKHVRRPKNMLAGADGTRRLDALRSLAVANRGLQEQSVPHSPTHHPIHDLTWSVAIAVTTRQPMPITKRPGMTLVTRLMYHSCRLILLTPR